MPNRSRNRTGRAGLRPLAPERRRLLAADDEERGLLLIGETRASCCSNHALSASKHRGAWSGDVFDPGFVNDHDVGREPIIPIINAIIEPVAVVVNDSNLGKLHSGLH